jgi:hypothetical protein
MYKTKDFVLASLLLANGFNLVGSDKKDGSTTVFLIFDTTNKEKLKNKIVDDFVNQQCLVNIKKYIWASKIIREEINKYKIMEV